MKLLDYAEARTQRRGEQAEARRRAYERELRQREADAARERPFADDYRERKILHRGIEYLLDVRRHSVYLVYEEHVVRLNIGQNRGEVSRALKRRSGRDAEVALHLLRDNSGERRFAEAGRAVEERVVKRLLALKRRRHENRQLVLERALSDKVVKRLRTESIYLVLLLAAHRFYKLMRTFVVFHFNTSLPAL